MEKNNDLSLFPAEEEKTVQPASVMWNLWHGCTKISPGCDNCYVYRRDAEFGKDTTKLNKTEAFNIPITCHSKGELRGQYKYPSGTKFFTCFTSDFFHPNADVWRNDAWRIIKTRYDCNFFIITKRPERIEASLPIDWESSYTNVEICCTCENQAMADKRLPIFLELPIINKSIIHEPMLEKINIKPYLKQYSDEIKSVTVGGESGENARVCDFNWVLNTYIQCLEYGVSFSFHQTGSKFKKGGRVFDIPRKLQREQAKKAGLDFTSET